MNFHLKSSGIIFYNFCIYVAQCYDKDCIENARVYLTPCGQSIIDKAINVKFTKAEVIWVFSDIEAVPFNRGFYSVDLKYFFKVTLAVFTGVRYYTKRFRMFKSAI